MFALVVINILNGNTIIIYLMLHIMIDTMKGIDKSIVDYKCNEKLMTSLSEGYIKSCKL